MSPQIPRQPPAMLLLDSPDWQDYTLLDSGSGLKLEQYGPFRLIRPEPEAMWRPWLDEKEWKKADAVFEVSAEENGGHWKFRRELPADWLMTYKALKFRVQTSASRHLGVFPEQAAQWDWIGERVRSAGRPLRVLNLFGYTGLASLAAAQAGAQVTHVDASPKVVAWARQNQELSGLSERPIRWIVDDVLKFVRREQRRNVAYDGLILDPPKFGRGPKGEVWEFYKLIPDLLQACRQVLGPRPQFVVLTAYAVKASALTLYYAMQEMMSGCAGQTEAGEAILLEQNGRRALAMAIFARWSAGGATKKKSWQEHTG
ncbi:MAG: class I SAM-dependent rRNA methyltransferase [Chloroflexi bacterium]|nr:class I SAM-dependent rRNA methyltransferase [Chloroflexota bacterium]